VDAKQALADLTEISSQIRSAVLLDESGVVAASTFEDEARASRVAEAALELLAAAERTRPGVGPGMLKQLEVATLGGSVFLVRDHGRTIVATTSPEPTVGLVFYDLKTCLKNAAEAPTSTDGAETAEQKPARARSRKQPPTGDAAP
jgi:predicted regulator of Ras-like GTPase activity (Roadblock/LC7/MglB family)